MIGVGELATYWRVVPSIGFVCTAPSITGGAILASLRLTAAVCGMLFAISASSACGVPATEALTFSFGLSSGMLAKSAGRPSLGTLCQDPPRFGERNQRPESST